MAQTVLIGSPRRYPFLSDVNAYRLAALVLIWAAWEITAQSGLLYNRIVPSTLLVAGAVLKLLMDPAFYGHMGVTGLEILAATAIGTGLGVTAGIAFGIWRQVGKAFEPLLFYLAPTPKIVLLPIMLTLFGVYMGPKIAVGALSAFFPIAISTAGGMREINPVYLRVARTFDASLWQIIAKIYLPALRTPVVTGFRLSFGLAIVGVLLAETKLSNQGLGFLAIQYYDLFRIPELYAVLAIIFLLAGVSNALIARFER